MTIIRRYPYSIAGTLLLAGLVILGFVYPMPESGLTPNPASVLNSPSAAHLFGTDSSGFDVLSRAIKASSRDLPIAITATFMSYLVGVSVGLYVGAQNAISNTIMRILDAFQSFPVIFLSMALVVLTGNNIKTVVLAIMLQEIPRFIRVVRSRALIIRRQRFVDAAIIAGASPTRIRYVHIYPNLLGISLAQASLSTAHGLIVISALNFLGIGIHIPDPAWGSMLREGASVVQTGAWWVAAPPAALIVVSILALNFIANEFQSQDGGV